MTIAFPRTETSVRGVFLHKSDVNPTESKHVAVCKEKYFLYTKIVVLDCILCYSDN